MAAGVTVYTLATAVTNLLTTELNGLAAGSFVTSSVNGASGVFNNSQQTIGSVTLTSTLNGYLRGLLTLTLSAPSAAFAANSYVYVWFLKSNDGTNFEDGSANPRPPDGMIPIEANANAQRITMDIKLPPGVWKVMAENVQGSGTQALAATGNALLVTAYTAGQ